MRLTQREEDEDVGNGSKDFHGHHNWAETLRKYIKE